MSKKILFLSAALIIGASLFVGVNFAKAVDAGVGLHNSPGPAALYSRQANVSFLRFKVYAGSSPLAITGIEIGSDSSNAGALRNLKLSEYVSDPISYTPVGATMEKLTLNNSLYKTIFTASSAVTVPAGGEKEFLLIADLGETSGVIRLGVISIQTADNSAVVNLPIYGNDFTVDMPDTLNYNVASDTPSSQTLSPGQTNIKLLKIKFTASGNHNIRLGMLSFRASGWVDYFKYLTNVRLYNENNQQIGNSVSFDSNALDFFGLDQASSNIVVSPATPRYVTLVADVPHQVSLSADSIIITLGPTTTSGDVIATRDDNPQILVNASGIATSNKISILNTSITYSLSLNPSGANGTIVSYPSGINCSYTSSLSGGTSGSCNAVKFPAGTVVTLTATPVSGNVFTNWSTWNNSSGGCTGSSPTCILTMNKDFTIGAIFSSAQTSLPDFTVTEVGVKYFAEVLNVIRPGDHYYAKVKNIGGDLTFTDSLVSGRNYLEIRFEGNTGWMVPINESAYRTRKEFEKGDKISRNQEFEFIALSTDRVPAGAYSIKATVNPEQTSSSIKRIIGEKDYNNNSLTKTVTIGSSKPSITVLSPNGGETVTIGGSYNVKWNIYGDTLLAKYLDLWLFKNGQQIGWVNKSLGIDFSSGSYIWDGNYTDPASQTRKISAPGGDYKIIAVLRGSSDKELSRDSSDSTFTITVSSGQPPIGASAVGVIKLGDGTYELNNGDKVKLDNGLIIVPVYFKSGSGSFEFSNVKFDVYLGATKLTTTDFTRVGWDTKTFEANAAFYDNFNVKYYFKVYVEQLGTSGGVWNSKITFKSGDTVRQETGETIKQETTKPINQITEITANANLLSNDKMGEILAELKELRNIIKEQAARIKYFEKLSKNMEKLSAKMENAINNFITYGVDANTVKLGEGERAAVMYSYKAAFDKLPETEAELADAIKIANGRWPSATNDEAEKKAKEQFQKIYKRIADMNDGKDNAAITVMAYGLRQKAENRNLNSEKQGIKIFKGIYGRTPNSTEDWNTMQAITYSGASRGTDSDGDLLTDDREEELGTDPENKDTDGDGYLDGVEVANGFDPLKK